MKILFFHRLDLVHLYAPISKKISNQHEIIHVAYSCKEADILRNSYNIQGDIYNLSKLRDDYFDSLSFDNEKIIELDKFIISNTNGRFCLNSSIYADRTYINLSYEDACKVSVVYYEVWKYIFNESQAEIFFHEPPALMMTHLASMFCKNNNAKYLTQIQVSGLEDYQWIFLEGDNAKFIEFDLMDHKTLESTSSNELDRFIKNANEDLSVLFNNIISQNNNQTKYKFFSLIRGVIGISWRTLKLKKTKIKKIDPRRHIEYYSLIPKKSFIIEIENRYGRLYESYYSNIKTEDKYFFYPLHLEPEAVVLYYADGWYEGQIKLIENIAAQLPPNTYLYVKDHPHGGNYRDVKDYKQLLRIRNLKLIDPNVSGKQLIKDSLGVITINGTSGFEALLMNKRVFCFGKSFYSNFKGVIYMDHIKHLRDAIYNSLDTYDSFDPEELESFIKCSHNGFVNFFSDRQNKMGIDLEDNTTQIVKGINRLIDKLN